MASPDSTLEHPPQPPRLLEGLGDYAELARCAQNVQKYQRRRSMVERRKSIRSRTMRMSQIGLSRDSTPSLPMPQRKHSLAFNRLRRTMTPVVIPGWRGTLHRMLQSSACDVITGLVIVFDVALTCVDIDIRAAGGTTPLALELASNACLMMYLLELVAILFVWKGQVFRDPWTLLDMLIVIFGLVQLVMGFMGVSLDKVTILRMLRVVRIMRLFRLFRKFAMLKELRKLIRMTASCFKTLCWSFLFCFVVMTSWAMLAVELLNPYMPELSSFWEDCPFCRRSLQSVMSANLLLFKTVVAGDSWGQVAVPLIEAHPTVAIPIFIGSQLSIVFGVLNLVVAVVVDTFAEQRTKDVTSMAQEMDEDAEEELQELDKIFAKIDSDNDGVLSWEELVKGASRVREFQHRLRVMDIDQKDLEQLFSMLDHNSNKTVDPDEFKRTLARWAFDSKTATRFVRYTLQQLMEDHSSAAEKLSNMESLVRDSLQDASPHPAPRRRRRRKVKAQDSGGSKDV